VGAELASALDQESALEDVASGLAEVESALEDVASGLAEVESA
jgi:hypothetical protein